MTATPAPETAGGEPSLGQLVHEASESVSDDRARRDRTRQGGAARLGQERRRRRRDVRGRRASCSSFSLTFGLIALAEGLIALGLPRWAGYLIVFGILLAGHRRADPSRLQEGQEGPRPAAHDRHQPGHRRLPQVAPEVGAVIPMGFGPIPGAPDSSTVLIDGPWTHRTVRANGIALHAAEAGTGPLVLLLHGFPQFWWTWHRQLIDLADAGFRAVAVDLRGFGASDKPPRGYDAPNVAADLAAVVVRARRVGRDGGRQRPRRPAGLDDGRDPPGGGAQPGRARHGAPAAAARGDQPGPDATPRVGVCAAHVPDPAPARTPARHRRDVGAVAVRHLDRAALARNARVRRRRRALRRGDADPPGLLLRVGVLPLAGALVARARTAGASPPRCAVRYARRCCSCTATSTPASCRPARRVRGST